MPQQQPRRLTLTVTPEQAGRRVDSLLRQELCLSGTVIRRIKWLEDGILLDGLRAITGDRVRAGQVLTVRVSAPGAQPKVPPAPGPLDIVYEDEDILVLNKPAGIPVHPGPGHHQDTLCNFIAWYYQHTGSQAGVHPVHRLDRGTSGLLVTAKHPRAQEGLKGQLHSHQFRRTYLAVCDGVPSPAQGVVEIPIGRKPGSLIARQPDPAGQSARTRYQVLSAAQGRALVELTLDTGRTHQIRVHMAYLGCPLTGDFLYGTEDQALITRPALHSAALSLRQPVTGQPLSWRLPLPPDMARLGFA